MTSFLRIVRFLASVSAFVAMLALPASADVSATSDRPPAGCDWKWRTTRGAWFPAGAMGSGVPGG